MADGNIKTAALRTELQKTMQNNAAVFRTGEVLEEGCEITQEVYDDMKNMKVYDRGMVNNTNIYNFLTVIVDLEHRFDRISRITKLDDQCPSNN